MIELTPGWFGYLKEQIPFHLHIRIFKITEQSAINIVYIIKFVFPLTKIDARIIERLPLIPYISHHSNLYPRRQSKK